MILSWKHPIGTRAGFGLLALTMLGGCPQPLDTTQSTTRGTVGEEVFRVACKRFGADAYPNDVSARNSRGLCAGEVAPTDAPASDDPVAYARLVSLAQHRGEVVEAIDTILPHDLESPTDRLLVSIVPSTIRPTTCCRRRRGASPACSRASPRTTRRSPPPSASCTARATARSGRVSA